MLFEITFVESGKTFEWTRAKCEREFGKAEFLEIEAGYLPHIVCCPVGG